MDSHVDVWALVTSRCSNEFDEAWKGRTAAEILAALDVPDQSETGVDWCWRAIQHFESWCESAGIDPGMYTTDDGGVAWFEFNQQPKYLADTLWVTAYEVDREYGGPEEGGWWYDTGQVVKTVQAKAEDVDRVREALEKAYPRNGQVSSVNYRGGDYRVRVEDRPGADYPTERPYYE
jgi:hypothetical protein